MSSLELVEPLGNLFLDNYLSMQKAIAPPERNRVEAASVMKKIAKQGIFRILSWLESGFPGEYELRYSPTFIIGPPRSGTTLVRQLVAWAIPTSYFTNFTRASWDTLGYPLPIMTARVVKLLGLTNHAASFESEYGFTTGIGRPVEGGDIWNYFFQTYNAPVEPEQLAPERQRLIYQAVAGTERIFDLPFVNKTVDLSVRIRALAKIFPSALFIQVVREPLDVAQSLYKARLYDYPDREFFSTRPRECEDLGNKSIVEQVCMQVYYIEKNIAFERSVVGPDRFLTVSYQAICEKPGRELERIAEFMNKYGAPARIVRSVPASFRYSHGCKIDQADYLAMAAYLEKLYRQDHEMHPVKLEVRNDGNSSY